MTFGELLKRLPPRNEFLAKHTRPALLLQPFAEYLDDNTADTDRTGSRVTTVQETFANKADMVPRHARVAWLIKKLDCPYRDLISLGRSPRADVVIPDSRISVLHAVFKRAKDCWVVYDRGSTNGTWVDRVKLVPFKPYPVQDGSELRFGPDLVVARFFEPDSLWAFCRAHGEG